MSCIFVYDALLLILPLRVSYNYVLNGSVYCKHACIFVYVLLYTARCALDKLLNL